MGGHGLGGVNASSLILVNGVKTILLACTVIVMLLQLLEKLSSVT